jgi:hypothetical protein
MRIAALIGFSVLLAACAGAPRPAGYPYSYQNKMQSAYHWEVLAKELVETQVIHRSSSGAPWINPGPIYVDDSDRSEFGKVFHTYLVTELINHGIYPLPRKDQNVIVVKWGTQLVCNSKPYCDFPGVIAGAVEIAFGVLVGTSLLPPPPNTELVTTIQVDRDGIILSRQTRNYYLNGDDVWNFWNPPESSGNTAKLQSNYRR